MASRGFGKTQPTKLDQLIGQAVDYSRRREPEALDKIFDNLPVEMNNKVLKGTLRELNKDIDTISWRARILRFGN
ncbi:hypothetical protein DSM106972_062750 [Dulcicalothrix desertica PCC 7102]|uniref:Uncharacterized protein n=1 Tax=Dulcicalothrix desertica PCC 7102 TaxID=232991 RepID=A0A433V7W4_9CYAN|nr:hypothetical protein [Dulcicalothrix desertica]RUT02200.1 hypothetical protein DSM106972_062750 [Dulcicalothrix desertica PCC 7102]TWH53838.1 hypothetical protein CAL7102_01826 [Dulcicalothrix desertica PCC 7102]